MGMMRDGLSGLLGQAWRQRLCLGLDCLLPPRCPSCGAAVHGAQRLCADCFGRLSFITAPACRRCSLPFVLVAEAEPGGECGQCRAHPPGFRRAAAALTYDEPARRLLVPFKHDDRPELAALLATLMRRAGGPLLAEAELLVPVPLHRRRLIRRRYNQSALLARRLAALADRRALPDALRRHRATAPLADLSAAERRRAVAGAFTVPPSAEPVIAGRRLLLIDDVLTSGATASACAEALCRAGAARVDLLVVARVPDPRRMREVAAAQPLVQAMAADDFTDI